MASLQRTQSDTLLAMWFDGDVICLLFVLMCSKTCLQQCSDSNSKLLIKILTLDHLDVDTCSSVTDLTSHLTSFLDSCAFTPVPSATHFSTCHAQCVTDDTCVALTFSSTNGCQLCIETVGSGNGNSYAQTDVMVAVQALSNHINGKRFRKMTCGLIIVKVCFKT